MTDLIWMETFAAVVDTGSFTSAAEQIGISKSFVSKQVSQLEDSLETRLLHRSTRKLSLTDEGAQFYKHCKLIVDEAKKAREEMRDSHESPGGRVRITVPQSLIISELGKALLRFQEKYPNIELEVIVSGSPEDLVSDGIDLAVRIGQLADSTLICRKLSECVFQAVASPQYIKKHGEPSQPAELTNHNCLIYTSSNINNHWPFKLPDETEVVVNTQGNLTSNDGHLIVTAALAGRGIAYGPSILYEQYVDKGELCLLLTEFYHPPLSIYLLYPSRQNLSRKVKALINFLSQHLSL